MSNKITLGILFGGRSVEHEVSILTGSQALQAANREKYHVQPVYLARDNVWYIGPQIEDVKFFRQTNPPLGELTRVYPCPDAMRGKLRLLGTESGMFKKPVCIDLDCVLPATHGTFVEDGSLQGLLDLAGVPYAGSDVRASAIGMDKLLFKAVMTAQNLPVLPYSSVNRRDWEKDREGVLKRLREEFPKPVFLKPAILGSSVGISRAQTRQQLEDGLDLGLKFCDRVLVEEAADNFIEINCSVIDGDPPLPSILEQPLSSSELLTFDEKYKGGAKGSKGQSGAKGAQGMATQQRQIPAPLDQELTATIQKLAGQAFLAVGAGGVARVDFIVIPPDRVYINELNNIPGSLSFYLWEHMGRSFSELIDRLVERAFEVQKIRNRTTHAFDSNLLASN